VIYGSYARDPLRARDLDLLVIVDRLGGPREKARLEYELSRILHREGIPADVVVLDPGSLRENAAPGTFLSGLVMGYKILLDEGLGLDGLLKELTEELARSGYEYWKGGRRWRLSALARVKRRLYKGEA
jgi:hypothetical protein